MRGENARELYSDSVAPVSRSSPGELFLITIEARPAPESEDAAEFGGAFVNCWVDVDDLRTAERRAVDLIREHGWQPYRFDEWQLVSRATYVDRKPEGGEDEVDYREVLDEAFEAGVSCIFHQWSADAEDG